jgi:hypothetical protein
MKASTMKAILLLTFAASGVLTGTVIALHERLKKLEGRS